MKKIALLSFAVLMLTIVRSQVIVSLQLPPLGITIKPQLWNLSLVNTGNAPVNVQIEMTMTDISNNLQVLTGTTKVFSLPVGAKQIQLSDVMPITYNAGSPGYGMDANPDGFLPVGTFAVCYSVTKLLSDAFETLGQECETIEIEPISPPQLVIPADQEHSDLTRPFFTWLPPSPYQLFNNLRYDWLLVEVLPLQSAAEAIQQNIPVLTQQNITYTNFQYPLSLQELDTAKQYAWRITAKNGIAPIATSETWTFRVRKPGEDNNFRKGDGFYTKLRREDDAAYIITSGVLRFEYLHETSDTTVSIKITDITTVQRNELGLDSSVYTVRYGQNFKQLDLRGTNVADRRLYILELTNAKNEKWYLKFEYRKPD